MENICKYCEKTCKNDNSHRNHERLCAKNPARVYVSRFGNKPPWNKGLTKATDSRVVANAVAVSASMKGKAPTWEWTAERRKKKSEWRKKLHQQNPESHPNRRLAKNKGKWTKPERIAAEWLDEHNIDYEFNKKIDLYYPDFSIAATNILIEIDGEYWHDKDKDAIRDARLHNQGYNVYRINSKSNIPDELERILILPSV
jgi:very-short-patch-repair endonuclease